jgi:RsiW-degrading membrane proteinase PrsW (M82 family)
LDRPESYPLGCAAGNGRNAAADHDETMTQRTRKFFGTILLLASIVIYSIIAMAIYANFLGGAPWWGLIAYFAVAGTIWFFPATWIIRWMARPDAA